jgi:hypothetical protein
MWVKNEILLVVVLFLITWLTGVFLLALFDVGLAGFIFILSILLFFYA